MLSDNKHCPAIVVPCYNRAFSLKRLISCLLNADYPAELEIPLVISIDGGGSEDVVAIAEDVEWPFGRKRVIKNKTNLGLKAHIFKCGNLTDEYGSIILLEDDLLVSPAFYQFARQLEDSGLLQNPSVCGASLYAYRYNETTLVRFHPVDDGFDNYYLQMPSSWGQLWNATGWSAFREWHDAHGNEDLTPYTPNLAVAKWGRKKCSSWKRLFAAYMVATSKFMLYSRASYSDNPGEAGTHHGGNAYFRSPLALACKQEPKFSGPGESRALYDQNFELSSRLIHRLYPELKDTSFSVCLNASALNMDQAEPLVLSESRPFDHSKTWGKTLYPIELNILLNIPGDDIGLTRKDNFNTRQRLRDLILGAEKILRVRGGFCLFAVRREKKLLRFIVYILNIFK